MANANKAVQNAASAAAAANTARRAIDYNGKAVLTVKDQAEITDKISTILSITYSALLFTARSANKAVGLDQDVAEVMGRAANLVYSAYRHVDGARGRVRDDVPRVAKRHPRSAEHSSSGLGAVRALREAAEAVHAFDQAVIAMTDLRVHDATELARQSSLLAYGMTVVCRNDGHRVNATYADVQCERRAALVQAPLVEAARLLTITQRITASLYTTLKNAQQPQRLSA